MTFFRSFTLLSVCLVTFLSWPTQVASKTISPLNNRPIIGILSQPDDDIPADEYIFAMYVQFLEGAGARVVAIRGNMPVEYYHNMFNKINGVLFPGGETKLDYGPYYESAKILFDLAIEANDRGDYFPIWGTCLGHQLLSVLTAKKNIRQETDSTNMTLPLTFVDGYQTSKLFRDMPSNLINYLSTEAIAQHNHEFALLVEDFAANEELSSFYQPLTTNKDRNGTEYVSTFEAYNYPIYGSQWHPEKNVYLWNAQMAIDHSPHAIKVSHYFGDFFVNEARKSYHHFDSIEDEIRHMIENDVRLFMQSDLFITRYFYNYTQDAN